jgi:hypothetical protein
MNNNFGNVKLSEWLWVLYPLLAAAFMFFSLNFLLGSGPGSMLNIVLKQDQEVQEEKNVAQLKAKLEILKSVDRDGDTQKLQALLTAMPSAKKIWYLVEAIDRSASSSGVEILNYTGVIGDVKEASDSATMSAQANDTTAVNDMVLLVNIKPVDFGNIYQFLKELETYAPLVKVVKITYDANTVSMNVSGAWGQFFSPVTDVSASISDNPTLINKALNDIEGLQDLTAGTE